MAKKETGETMRIYRILNPASGKGGSTDGYDYITKCKGDCRSVIAEEAKQNPDTLFIVSGGDGTANEAVNGILDAGAGKTAVLSIQPRGSGNDTVKTADTYEGVSALDAILVNGDHGINMINIGFDCNVVDSAAKFKKIKGVSGKLSYILGVIREFFKPFGTPFTVTAELSDGETFTYSEPSLLCAVCNGQWCGGSFHNSPLSDMRDGILEMILVRKTGRLNFIRMIGKYKSGTLFDQNGEILEKYRDIVIFKRIRRMKLTGCTAICTDGEITECSEADISVEPQALRYVSQKNASELQTIKKP